jgi:DNA polymerase-3 subunit delta
VLGSDRPKVRRAVARLRARFAAESIEHLSADTSPGADAVAACNAIGLFGDGGARLVLVEGVERWSADDVEAVTAYLELPVETNVLALVAEGALRSTTLVAAVERAGSVLRFDAPKPRDLPGWVRAEFDRLGGRADADAARALVEIVGDDVTELASEIDKLVTWAGDDAIGRREVEALAVSSGDTFVWALTDAWGARDAPKALAACEALTEGRAKEPFAVAAALASYVGRVRTAQALGEEGLTAPEIAKRLKIKDYPARKALGHGKNFTRDELDLALVRLAALDVSLKGGSRLAPELQLERALVDLTEARRPAGVTADD